MAARFRRNHHDSRGRALAAGSLGVLLAGFFAGAFEYNFGDSEFQMLFLFAMTIPWILDRVTDHGDGDDGGAEAST